MSLQDSYAKIRDQLSTGDLFAYHRKSLFDWLIDLWTDSQFDHVNLVVKLEIAGVTRLCLHNAEPETGVSLIPISTYLAKETGKVWWVQLDQELACAENPNFLADLTAYVMTTLGRRYDWAGILKFVFPFIKQRKKEEFCSELAAEDLRAGKLVDTTFLSPGQLVRQAIFNAPRPLL